MLAKPLILAVLALGAAWYHGFSLFDWIYSLVTVVFMALGAVLSVVWKMLHPNADNPQQFLPDLHQAIFKVTRDATRVADLLEEFFAQQHRDDPALKDKFMAYMVAQANTSYSVVDNQLSWILWLYSMIWMPLLVGLCFARAARTAGPAQPGGTRTASGNAVQCVSPQQGSGSLSATSKRWSSEDSMTHTLQMQGSTTTAGWRASFDPSLASAGVANIRALRRSATITAARDTTHQHTPQQQLHASNGMYMQQQRKLASSASVPAQVLGSSNGGFKLGRSTSLASAFDTVRPDDQYTSGRGSASVAEPVYNLQMGSSS